MTKSVKTPGLPSRQQILDFIAGSDQPAGKREIARAFGLSGQDKIALKTLLRDMADEGLIDSAPGRAFHRAGGVPRVTVLRVVDVDDSGQATAVPERWESDAPIPRLRLIERGRRGSALGVGDRVLARTEEAGAGMVAHPMKKLLAASELVLGVIHKEADAHWLRPVDKREKRELPISDLGSAEVGDLVLAEKSGRPPRITARVTDVLGDPFQPRSFSLIAIHKHGIPDRFGEGVEDEARRVAKLPLGPISPAKDRSPPPAQPEPVEGRSFLSEPSRKKEEASTSSAQTGKGNPARTGSSNPFEREDLRHLPIVAIDPADARDHDDAVWAEADGEGGWRAVVAIADVSFYVRPGSKLDKEARRRGNSVYFPDRVVPMLPEELSADVCSLKQGEDRAALACHLRIGADGKLKHWRFTRAVIRVRANIAYEDAQAAMDAWEEAAPETQTRPSRAASSEVETRPSRDLHEDVSMRSSTGSALLDLSGDGESLVNPELIQTALVPLWACWRALWAERTRREPLDLDLPERRVVLDEKGRILSVAPRERLDAHKLIEEYMIAANVAAAKALEARRMPVMYRDHEPPTREKLVALKDYLDTFDLPFALGQVIRPATFNRILERVRSGTYPGEGRGPDHDAAARVNASKQARAGAIESSGEHGGLDPGLRRGTPGEEREDNPILPQVMEQVLRTQTQAYYGPENTGHFGLALGSYAHFTSPIRRYADLLVHRALVRAYGLGPDAKETGLSDAEVAEFEELGTLISRHERRAMEAERDTVDRYVAAYLATHVGQLVRCRITGVQPFGFFATVEDLGGDGLVPASTLPGWHRYDEKSQTLESEDGETRFTLGQRLELRLVEADPVNGSLRFELPEGAGQGRAPPRVRRDRTRGGPPKGVPRGRKGRRS